MFYSQIFQQISVSPKEKDIVKDQLEHLLDYEEHVYAGPREKIIKFVTGLLHGALARLQDFDSSKFDVSHTISDDATVSLRRQMLIADRRTGPPPNLLATADSPYIYR